MLTQTHQIHCVEPPSIDLTSPASDTTIAELWKLPAFSVMQGEQSCRIQECQIHERVSTAPFALTSVLSLHCAWSSAVDSSRRSCTVSTMPTTQKNVRSDQSIQTCTLLSSLAFDTGSASYLRSNSCRALHVSHLCKMKCVRFLRLRWRISSREAI